MKYLSKLLFIPLLFAGLLSCSIENLEPHYFELAKIEEEEEEEVDEKLVIRHMYFDEPGDCTYISVGGKNIIVDTGPSDTEFLSKLDSMGLPAGSKIDYLIITHQDEDHIGNAVTLFGAYKVGTLIDFDCTYDTTLSSKHRNAFKSCYTKKYYDPYSAARSINSCVYCPASILFATEKRDVQVSNIVKMLQAKKEGKQSDSNISKIEKQLKKKKPNEFQFEVGDRKLTIKILYNKFNTEILKDVKDDPDAKDYKSIVVNNMSIPVLISYGGDQFLFTGDLMEHATYRTLRLKGETELVKNNPELKDGVIYYRGGHHGSRSSNSREFMEAIRPQYVFWSGGKQSTNYKFPTNTSIYSAGNFTDKIYYSSIDEKLLNPKAETNECKELYGETWFTYDPNEEVGNKVSVETNVNSTEVVDSSKKQPDSLFLSDLCQTVGGREYAAYIYNLTSKNDPENPVDCTYIKVGHVDILIGAGSKKEGNKKEIVNKIRHLCNDKVLDYVIVPTPYIESYRFLIDDDGLFKDSNYKIDNLIYQDNRDNSNAESFAIFFDAASDNEGNVKKMTSITSVSGGDIILPLASDSSKNSKKIKLHFLNNKYNFQDINSGNREKCSIATLLQINDFKYLNLGNNYTYGYEDDLSNLDENYLLDNNSIIKNDIDVLQMPYYGYLEDVEKSVPAFYKFVSEITCQDNDHNLSFGTEQTRESDGLTVLMNTTSYINADGKNMYPGNFSTNKGVGQLKYKIDGEEKKILCFPTLKTVDNSRTEGYYTALNGDLCMRITFEKKQNNEEVYTKITYGINRNYASKEGELLFADVSSTDNIESKFGDRNNTPMIDTHYFESEKDEKEEN